MGQPVVHFEIGCKDSARTQEFYAKLFDWKIVPAGPAAWPQEREPEQGGRAPELEQPGCLRRGQVEQGKEGVRVQVGA